MNLFHRLINLTVIFLALFTAWVIYTAYQEATSFPNTLARPTHPESFDREVLVK